MWRLNDVKYKVAEGILAKALSANKDCAAYHLCSENKTVDLFARTKFDMSHLLAMKDVLEEEPDDSKKIDFIVNMKEVEGCSGCHCDCCTEATNNCCQLCIQYREYKWGEEKDNGFCTDGCKRVQK